jgi:hypothetical protein
MERERVEWRLNTQTYMERERVEWRLNTQTYMERGWNGDLTHRHTWREREVGMEEREWRLNTQTSLASPWQLWKARHKGRDRVIRRKK